MKNKKIKYTYNVLGLAIIIFLAIREICGALFAGFGFQADSFSGIGIYMVIFLASCLVPTIMMENVLGVHPKMFKKVNPENAINLVFYSYLIIFITGIANGIIHALLKMIGLDFKQRLIQLPENKFILVLYFVFICIMPAILEEIFIRGYVFNAFKQWGQTFAIFVSSLCFALMHSSLDNILVYFVCGVLLAIVYIITDSIFTCMLLHFVNNTVSFFIMYFQQQVNAVSALTMIAYINVATIVFGIIAKLYLDKNNIRIRDYIRKDDELFKKLMASSKSYFAISAFALLLFFAAYQSFISLT